MRITGIEVSNYAGFQSQYIPINKGVQLLVGKNNAGKSALLRLIDFQNDPAWRSYIERNQEAGLAIWYRPINSDRFGPRNNESGARSVVADEQVGVHATIRATGEIAIQRVDLLTSDSQTLPLLQRNRNGSGFTEHTYHVSRQDTFGSNSRPNPEPFESYIPNDLQRAIFIRPTRAVGTNISAGGSRDVPRDGRTLAQFLQTLQGDDHDLYSLIEDKFCRCFPEFTKVSVKFQDTSQQPPSAPSQFISISLTERNGRKTDLQNCGAGVEQALIMLTCVFGVSDATLFLIDEPHNFLHPSLERVLIDLFSESQHSFILATHSAQMINRVSPSQIISIEKPGTPKSIYVEMGDKTKLLSHLGFRNSDLLFHDALIFVEGPSDPPIFASLFGKAGCTTSNLDVGYAELGGTREFQNFDAIQRLVIVQEKLLQSFSKTHVPHVYLFDGDKAEHQERLEKTRPAGTPIRPVFLEVYEVENYLLEATAIERAINLELKSLGLPAIVPLASIQKRLDDLLCPQKLSADEMKKFYPQGYKEKTPRQALKGSRALEDIYSLFSLTYNKRTSGTEIAANIVLMDEPKAELQELFARFGFA